MDKQVFEQKIAPLGQFKKISPGTLSEGHNDLVFVPQHEHKPCPDCDLMVKNRLVLFERRYNRNDELEWRTKCYDCKKKWPELRL